MNLEEIKKSWHFPVLDESANVAVWDSMASHFGSRPLPQWNENPFLIELEADNIINEEMNVLDIGCGTGSYSLVLADKVKTVTGIDLSPGMIKVAKGKKISEKKDNVRFLEMDWEKINLEEVFGEEKFDLVIAHMTPAVADAGTFEKMLKCAKRYCYFVKPIKRTDSVLDVLRNIVNHNNRPESFDNAILYAFEWIWSLGLLPSLSYRDEVWDSEKELSEAIDFYTKRLLTYSQFDEEKTKEIKVYLESISENELIREVVRTKIATMKWNIKEGD